MIIGVNFTSVSADINTESKSTGGITVDSSPQIVDILPADFLGLKDAIAVKFEFKTQYKPDLGNIMLQGILIYRGENVQKVLDQWKNKNPLESSFAVEVLNAIFQKCMAKSVELADDVRLPPPIQFPQVREGTKVEENVDDKNKKK